MRRNYSDLINLGTLDWSQDLPSERILAFTKTYRGQTLRAYFNQGNQDLQIGLDKNTKIVLTNLAEFEGGYIQVRPGTYMVSVN